MSDRTPMSDRAPILVTGSHRSGTTWVGRTLAYAPGTAYVHEPFNPDSDRGLCAAPFDRQYTYIDSSNEAAHKRALDDTFELRYRPLARLRSRPGLGQRLWSLMAVCIRWPQFTFYRMQRRRPIIKDPTALFAAPWLADRYGARVVVLIRHPAAFAGSLKKKDWTWRFDFDAFREQPTLIDSYLADFADELRQAGAHPPGAVEEAILLWRMFYTVIDDFRRSHPDWIFLRHEDLSEHPRREFETLFARLNLPFDARIRTQIAGDTSSGRNADQFDIKRDSRANITRWKERLTNDEIDRVRRGTQDVWPLFYEESDW